MKEFLSKNNVDYEYVEIMDSLANLKLFFKYRDNRPEFDEVKKEGRVGIPCIVVNDGEKVILNQPSVDELK
jgi:glutaredoxin-related protein